MILRNVAIRHGCRTLAAPLQKSSFRFLTVETLQEQLPISSSNEGSLNQLHLANKIARPDKPLSNGQVRRNQRLSQHIRKRTRHLGADIVPHYEPHHLLVDPPKPEDVTLELLMASQSHMGHSTSLWNPMNQRYIFGVREGIHIISLETTAAHLRRAAKVVEGVAYHGGLILFVGTRKGQAPCVVKAAELAKGYHLFERWIPGSITNKDIILADCKVAALDKDDEVLEGFDDKIEEWTALKPDLVVVLNPLENYILLHECGLNNIPTIGVIDTDADPTWVTYPIPANDDSIRCAQLIAGVLGHAGQIGQEKRLEAAKIGEVTWLPPPGLGKPWEDDEEKQKQIKEEQRAKRHEQAAAARETQVHGRRTRGRTDEEDVDDL